MSKPWHDLAEKALGSDDKVEKTYSCTYDKQNGFLCLGRKKLVFVSVKGFLKKSYNVLLDVPYDEIDEVGLTSRYRFNVIHEGKTHQLETSDISAKLVVKGIEDIVKTSPLNPTISFKGL